MNPDKNSGYVDFVGILAGSACAIHCGLSALAPGILMMLGLGALIAPFWEWTFVGVAILMATSAAWMGWRRHHDMRVVIAFSFAMSMLLAARLGEEFEVEMGPWLAILGGVTLAGTHIWNMWAASPRRVRAL